MVTAHEIDPIKKIKLQATLQKYIDSSISVTTNLPKDVSIEEVDQIYRLAWELECKGCTIYREGSRAGILGVSSTSLVRESHEILDGRTIMIPLKDKVYITVNYHPITEKPMEVFISSAKSGSDKKAINEGYGRLISLFLQQGGNIEDVITTLLDIKGESIEFANGWTVQSLPDAIAKGLLKCTEGLEVKVKCPECGGSVVMSSGCFECKNCGYSRCG
jgi:ribonucleoside-diphosphate reductase alpha chain